MEGRFDKRAHSGIAISLGSSVDHAIHSAAPLPCLSFLFRTEKGVGPFHFFALDKERQQETNSGSEEESIKTNAAYPRAVSERTSSCAAPCGLPPPHTSRHY